MAYILLLHCTNQNRFKLHTSLVETMELHSGLELAAFEKQSGSVAATHPAGHGSVCSLTSWAFSQKMLFRILLVKKREVEHQRHT